MDQTETNPRAVMIAPGEYMKLGKSVELGSNYLTLSEDITEEEIAQAYVKLRSVNGSMQWYLGDFFNQIEMSLGEAIAHQMLEAFAVGERSAYDACKVARSIPVKYRKPSLSFSHHLIAVVECDDLSSALEWLDVAVEKGLSGAGLRQAIRLDRQSKFKRPGARLGNNYRPVYQALACIKQVDAASLPAADRSALRADLKPLIEFYNSL